MVFLFLHYHVFYLQNFWFFCWEFFFCVGEFNRGVLKMGEWKGWRFLKEDGSKFMLNQNLQ